MTRWRFVGISLISPMAVLSVWSHLAGQVAEPELTFEVASVKPVARPDGPTQMQSTPSSFTLRNGSILSSVVWAYGVRRYQVKWPQGSKEQYFDIVAKTADGSTDSMRRSMMRSLLKDRFGFTFHREQKLVPTYELVAAKGGSKLVPSKAETGPGFPEKTRDSFELQHVSMAEFVEDLGILGATDHPVVDRTGIEGFFDISLKFRNGYRPRVDAPGDASIFSVLGELGLKLELRDLPTEVLVIDHIEKVPTEN